MCPLRVFDSKNACSVACLISSNVCESLLRREKETFEYKLKNHNKTEQFSNFNVVFFFSKSFTWIRTKIMK